MKKIILSLTFAAVVVSCQSDKSSPSAPSAPSEITVDNTKTSFDTVTATDVGAGIDINLKSSGTELAVRLEGKNSATYPVTDLTGAGTGGPLNSIVILTKSGSNPLVSKSGTVTITVANGKISGTIEVDTSDAGAASSSIVKIKGSFNAIPVGDQSALGCMIEKILGVDNNLLYRYDVNGTLTERRFVKANGDVSDRRAVAQFNGKIVGVIQVGDNHALYPVEYNGQRVSKTSVMVGGATTDVRNFEYDADGRVTKISGSLSICFDYTNSTISSDGPCGSVPVVTYAQFDDKSSPYALIKTSLQNQDALLYRFHPFGGYFSTHNLVKYNQGGLVTTIAYQYNTKGYPIESKSTSVPASGTITTTFSYRNCN